MITPVLIISLVLLIPILILPLNFINIVLILLFSISIATASDDILKGDTIIAINGSKIETIDDFIEITNKYKNK